MKGKIASIMLFLAICFICIFFYSNYDKNIVSPINELHEKGRLSYDDILATAETHDMIFHQVTDDDFTEKWFFVTSYTTDNGDILLLSDYEGDLFFRKKQSRILGWIEDDMSKKYMPSIISDAITSFGKPLNENNYLYRAYAAKNILAYFITNTPATNNSSSDNEQQSPLIEADSDNFKTIEQVFLYDINNLEHRHVEKDINHGQIKIDLECYQTPTEYAQVILYDDYLAYTITLTFDEEFFTTHQGQKIVLSLKEPYNNTNLQKTRDFDGQTLVFQSNPKFIISGFKEENIDFNAVITIENGSTYSYKEALELNL